MSDFVPIAKPLNSNSSDTGINNSVNGKSLSSSNFAHLLANSEVTISDTIEKPQPCLEIEQNGKSIPMATFGNISLVLGKAKSRKTFLVTIFLAAVLRKNALFNFGGTVPENKSTVLLFDTEQSKYHVQRVIQRCYSLVGIENKPDLLNFKIFSLRKYNPGQRVDLIQYAINNTENLGFVVIDGIKDLLMDINSPYDATTLTSLLLKWTEELDIHILTVLHANKGDNNARGHLGTELVNKAESVIAVTKHTEDQNISTVTSEYSRDIQFEPFAFSINDDGIPVLDEDFILSAIKSKKGTDPTDFDIPIQKEIAEKVFKENTVLGYEETWRGIKYALNKYMIKIGDNKAKDWLTHFKNEGYIKKVDKKYKLSV